MNATEILREMVAHLESEECVRGDDSDAPGHCHDHPGIWDDDNDPEIAGKPCEWCAIWRRAREFLKGENDE